MTPQEIITTARVEINDTKATYRNSTDDLLVYVNAGIKEIAIIQPKWFITIGHLTCVQNEVEQRITLEDAVAFHSAIRVHGGDFLTPMDMATLSAFSPDWGTHSSGAAQHWSPSQDDPLTFFIYPKAPAEQVLDIKYVRRPPSYTINQSIDCIPDVLFSALVDYVVHREEIKDDESVNSGRSAQRYESFVSKVKGA